MYEYEYITHNSSADEKINFLLDNGYVLEPEGSGDYIKVDKKKIRYVVSKIEIDYNPFEWIKKKVQYHNLIFES